MEDDERQANNDRQAWLILLGLFGFGLFMFSLASFDEAAKAKEPRFADLASGVLLMLATFAIALVAYRVATGPARKARAAAFLKPGAPGQMQSPSGSASKEFWITTAIAVVGLVISAVTAVAAWRA